MTASIPAHCSTSLGTATSCTRSDIPSCAQTASMGSGRTHHAPIVSHGGPSERGTALMHISPIRPAVVLSVMRSNSASSLSFGAMVSVQRMRMLLPNAHVDLDAQRIGPVGKLLHQL